MKNLMSMTDFVLEQQPKLSNYEKHHYYNECLDIANLMVSYAKFLKQPLELWMFVPCDDNGNVIDEPIDYKIWEKSFHPKPATLRLKSYMDYQQAKERCLFERFGYKNETETHFILLQNNWEKSIPKIWTIEDLIGRSFDLKLTKTALK